MITKLRRLYHQTMLINALILARSSSKRLPNKNIKKMLNKPLIAWTIEAAKKSKYIKDIYVSTDSELIANISKSYGAIVPRLRRSELAKDETTSYEAAIDFEEYFKINNRYEMLLLQPTSPVRMSIHIDNFLEYVRQMDSSQCVSVRDISPTMKLLPKIDEIKNIKYVPNGSMYYTLISTLKKEKTFFSSESDVFIMDNFHSIDIDIQDDWNIAEACLAKKLNDNSLS